MPPVRELDLPARPAPYQLAAALVRGRALHGDFFLYAGNDRVRLAGNWLATVTVSSDCVSLAQDGRAAQSEPAADPIVQAGRLLASLPRPDWTAYGFFAFDLARFGFPYRWAYDGPLLKLCVPSFRSGPSYAQRYGKPNRARSNAKNP